MYNKVRRSSSSLSERHQNSTSSTVQQPSKQDYEQVYKSIDIVRKFLKIHYKEKNLYIQEQELKASVEKITEGLKRYKKIKEYHEESQNKFQTVREKYEVEKRRIIEEFQHELKYKETEFNQEIVNMKVEIEKKETSYKELISRVMASLYKAESTWKNIFNKIGSKLASISNSYRNCKENMDQNHFLSNGIMELVTELNLRKEQDSLCSRKSLDLSSCFIDGSPENEKPFHRNLHSRQNSNEMNIENEHRRNHLDYSSIQINDEHQFEEQGIAEGQPDQNKNLDYCLRMVILCGLFTEENRKKVNKMIDLTNTFHEYFELLNSPLYPLMLDALSLRFEELQRDMESKHMTLEDISYNESSIQINRQGFFKNIESLQDLSFRENRENIPPCQEAHFKKKKGL